ncbi:hypothetical protein FRC17_002546, partial [Serendipita sp. 399]
NALASEQGSSVSSTERGDAHSSATVHSDTAHPLVRRNDNQHLYQSIEHHQRQLDTLEAAHPGLRDTFRQKDREAAQAHHDHERALKNNQVTQAHIDNKRHTADERRRAHGRLTENEYMQDYHRNTILGHSETIQSSHKLAQMSEPYTNGPQLAQDILQHDANARAAYASASVAHHNAEHSRANQY